MNSARFLHCAFRTNVHHYCKRVTGRKGKRPLLWQVPSSAMFEYRFHSIQNSNEWKFLLPWDKRRDHYFLTCREKDTEFTIVSLDGKSQYQRWYCNHWWLRMCMVSFSFRYNYGILISQSTFCLWLDDWDIKYIFFMETFQKFLLV